MNTPRRTVEQKLERHLHRREHQIRALQSSRDYWMRRAMLAERELLARTKPPAKKAGSHGRE